VQPELDGGLAGSPVMVVGGRLDHPLDGDLQRLPQSRDREEGVGVRAGQGDRDLAHVGAGDDAGAVDQGHVLRRDPTAGMGPGKEGQDSLGGERQRSVESALLGHDRAVRPLGPPGRPRGARREDHRNEVVDHDGAPRLLEGEARSCHVLDVGQGQRAGIPIDEDHVPQLVPQLGGGRLDRGAEALLGHHDGRIRVAQLVLQLLGAGAVEDGKGDRSEVHRGVVRRCGTRECWGGGSRRSS